ncbi:MAG: hypothetical protein ACI90C_000866, partial [Rhodoferax sp.]
MQRGRVSAVDRRLTHLNEVATFHVKLLLGALKGARVARRKKGQSRNDEAGNGSRR